MKFRKAGKRTLGENSKRTLGKVNERITLLLLGHECTCDDRKFMCSPRFFWTRDALDQRVKANMSAR